MGPRPKGLFRAGAAARSYGIRFNSNGSAKVGSNGAFHPNGFSSKKFQVKFTDMIFSRS
jgi:hypothetical protein